MGPVLLFLIATVVSAVGSLQAGLVNTAVLAHTVRYGRQAGRRVAIGGAFPELIYAGAAYVLAQALLERTTIAQTGIARVTGALFLALGAYLTFLYKPTGVQRSEVRRAGFGRGLVLGFANPQLFVFWCGVIIALRAQGMADDGLAGMVAFAVGAFTGALLLLLLVVRLGQRAAERWTAARLRTVFRAVGVLLMVSGAMALMRTWP